MLFLGTGAAELYPNPYCNCEFCESLRQSGEAPRKRSSLLLDAHTLVDLGPDALAAAQMYNARLYDVDHLFLTHSHEDHLCITNLEVLTMTPQRNEKPLHVYLSEPAHVFLTRYMQALRGVYAQGETGLETLIRRGVVELHSFPSYVPVRVGGMEASCSSYRSSNTYLCDASCAFDGDSTSAWNSNDDRNGQWLNVEWPIGTQRIAGFAVINGYAKNSDVWTNNSRVRLIAVYADGEDYLGTFYLRDDEQTQYFPIDGGVECSSLLFRFTTTYAGARYDDLCVSEIALYGYGDDPGVIPFTGNVSSQSEASASSYSGGSVVRGVNGDSYLRTGPGLGYDRTG